MTGAVAEELLFLDADFRREVEQAVSSAAESVEVLVGYCKVSAMQWLASYISGRDVDVSVVVGWTLEDLVGGSSDLEAYSFAREHGWRFGIRPELHAKIFWLDRVDLLVGSANLTTRGLHLGTIGNIEAGVRITPTNIDKTKLDQLIAKSVWLDDQQFADISAELEGIEIGTNVIPAHMTWPDSIKVALDEMKEFLWVDDMFLTDPRSKSEQKSGAEQERLVAHDRNLLGGLYTEDDKKSLAIALRRTAAVRWLVELLDQQEDRWARFGAVSAALHDALMDDPKPYRRDVKALQSNLFAWIEFAEMAEFELRKHRRTTSIHKVSQDEADEGWF
jgi:hypothetical protein